MLLVIFAPLLCAAVAFLREMNLTLVGFVDEGNSKTFLSYPVWQPKSLTEWEFDAVLLADLDRAVRHKESLEQYQVPGGKILAIGPSG